MVDNATENKIADLRQRLLVQIKLELAKLYQEMNPDCNHLAICTYVEGLLTGPASLISTYRYYKNGESS